MNKKKDKERFIRIRGIRRRLNPGLAGYRNEFSKLTLGSEGMTNDLFVIASRYVQTDIPDSINLALHMYKRTVIQKMNGNLEN